MNSAARKLQHKGRNLNWFCQHIARYCFDVKENLENCDVSKLPVSSSRLPNYRRKCLKSSVQDFHLALNVCSNADIERNPVYNERIGTGSFVNTLTNSTQQYILNLIMKLNMEVLQPNVRISLKMFVKHAILRHRQRYQILKTETVYLFVYQHLCRKKEKVFQLLSIESSIARNFDFPHLVKSFACIKTKRS